MTIFENNRSLLDRFREGETQALAEVYRHYLDLVWTVVHRGFTLGAEGQTRVAGIAAPDSAREFVQEVFTRAFSEKARESYDGLRPYRPFLLQIARNLLIDHWRKHAREIPFDLPENPSLASDGGLEISPLAFSSPEDELHWRTLQSATQEYLSTLSPKLREFIRLRFEEEHSQQEISERLKITRWQVRALDHKVQANLRRHLKRRKLLDI